MESSRTIPELIDHFVKKYRNKLLLQRRDGWSWKQITWLDFDDELKNISSFLLSLNFNSGDSAVTISTNCNECFMCEIAIYSLGGNVIPFPSFESFFVLKDEIRLLKPKFLFIESTGDLEKIKEDQYSFDLFEKIFVFDKSKIGENRNIIPYRGIVQFGQLKKKKLGDKLKIIANNIDPDQSVLRFISRNGSMQAQELVLDHNKVLEIINKSRDKLKFITHEDQSYSLMGGSNIFEKLVNLIGLTLGMRLIIAEDRESFYTDVLEAKPTVMFKPSINIDSVVDKYNSASKYSSIKDLLGGRLTHLITDRKPRKQITDIFHNSDIKIVEVPELNNSY